MTRAQAYCSPCRHYEVCKFREKVEEVERKTLPEWTTSTSPIALHVSCQFMDREEKE